MPAPGICDSATLSCFGLSLGFDILLLVFCFGLGGCLRASACCRVAFCFLTLSRAGAVMLRVHLRLTDSRCLADVGPGEVWRVMIVGVVTVVVGGVVVTVVDFAVVWLSPTPFSGAGVASAVVVVVFVCACPFCVDSDCINAGGVLLVVIGVGGRGLVQTASVPAPVQYPVATARSAPPSGLGGACVSVALLLICASFLSFSVWVMHEALLGMLLLAWSPSSSMAIALVAEGDCGGDDAPIQTASAPDPNQYPFGFAFDRRSRRLLRLTS